jgi:2-polyprenyl-3-methyl-5-hydroxy-6-metoxy-1,4-benzoquinol methylase
MEWKLFAGDVPHVSTFEFHEHRERAPHLEQQIHQARLHLAYSLTQAAGMIAVQRGVRDRKVRVVDLGCGDGGLLSLLKGDFTCHGYDFQPSNEVGWAERGVNAEQLDFVANWDIVLDADIYVITECLEHLADPHGMVQRIYDRGAQIIASSPHTEHAGSHDECHAWAWDQAGYSVLLRDAGFKIKEHVTAGMFQVIWGAP